jgi:cytochrome oxidase Cu insertion factor (SCO1/SenC/PrrC family)
VSPRIKLVLIGLACLSPFVLATLAYRLDWAKGGETSNYGELLTPQVVAAPGLDKLRGKWVLVMADAAACDAYCERKLYFMRQVRRAQGKEQERIERLWLLTDEGKPRPEVLEAIEGTKIHRSTEGVFAKEHIYLVDPLGNLMMRFPRDPDPSRMIKDLQRLLKYSRIG